MSKETIVLSFTLLFFLPTILFAEFEPNNTQLDANLLTSPMSGQLMTTSDYDWYYIEVTERGNLHITFDGSVGFLYSYYSVVVYDSELNPLVAYADPGEFSVGLAKAGKYYLRIADNASFTTAQYTITKSFESENYLPVLQGIYKVDRLVETYNDGSSFDTELFDNLIGTAVFLPDEFLATYSFEVDSDNRYYYSEHASYTVSASNITMQSHLTGLNLTGSYSWSDLELTFTGNMTLSSGTATFTYYLSKSNNIDIMDPYEDKIHWDINNNNRIDLPDTINSLRVLSGL